MKQIGPRIPKELFKKVTNKCIDEDKNLNQVVVELLTKWVDGDIDTTSKPFQFKPQRLEPDKVETPKPKPKPTYFNFGMEDTDEPQSITTDEAQARWLADLDK